jgi:hydrogenase/urease accessory protein HupE
MKMRGRSAALTLLICLLAASAGAHEARPGYLQLTLHDGESVNLLLKVPAIGQMRLGLYPNLPPNCVAVEEPTRYIIDNAYTERASFNCSGGLFGETVAIDGLSTTLTDVLARVERPDGTTQVARLTPAAPTFVVEATPNAIAIASTYLVLGVNHILLGIDHLLFVFALLLLVSDTRKLIWTITAFTAAHSLTLAAATLGFVQVPQSPVEAVIALSIVFVASEIVHVSQGRPGLTQRRPWIVAFVFGLLHGFGFAGALNEIGLPEQSIPLALLLFNVGVELGQLGFIAVVILIRVAFNKYTFRVPQWVDQAPAYLIGSVAAYWTIERTVGFWS